MNFKFYNIEINMSDVAWIKQNSFFNTIENDVFPSIAVNSDRVYVAYSTGGTVLGGTKTSGEYNTDIVVMSMNKGDGTVRWVKQDSTFNASTSSGSPSIAADSTGIYVLYIIAGGTIPGGSNPDNKSAIVVMKMNDDGNITWIKQYNKTGLNLNNGEIILGIDINSGGIYVTYDDTTSVVRAREISVMRISKDNGDTVWTKNDFVNSTSFRGINPSIAADSDGVYLTYTLNALNGIEGSNREPPTIGSPNALVVRMNTDGVVQWTKQYDIFSSNIELPLFTNIDTDSDGVYLVYNTTGNVINQTIESDNNFDIVVMKLRKDNGDTVWKKQNLDFNTISTDIYPNIVADSTGLYITNFTSGVVPGGEYSGVGDVVVFRMSKDGNVEWIKQNSTFNTSLFDAPSSISVDSDGLYITYQTEGTVPGGSRPVGDKSQDIVVLRMNKPPSVCLLEGTLVRTPSGSTPIELIKEGDYVLNQHYNPVRVTLTTSRTLQYNANPTTKCDLNNVLYTLPSGTLGATSNVYLSKHHKFMTSDGTMKKPEEYGLKRSELSDICKTGELYTVYHLRLEDEYNNHFIVNGDCIVEDWSDWLGPKSM